MNISSLSFMNVSRQIFAHRGKCAVSAYVIGSRCLYTPSALGLDGYLQVRERVVQQFTEMGSRFRTKMRDFVAPGSPNMVFTEDLKHMVHLAEGTEEDMELIEQMVLKFNSQSKDIRFGSFIFGPVIMRMYHHLNKPKEALKMFTNPALEGLFNQIISFQILMDLLFVNEMYDEVMEVEKIIRDKQIQNARFPKSVVALGLAAAYKKNTPESLQYMKELWAMLQETGHMPLRKSITFAAALAINQNAPHIAMELLSQLPKHNYMTVRNLKVSALTDLNRLDDVLPVLRSVLEMEGPQEYKHTFCTEVIDKVKAAVDKSDAKDLKQEFQRVLEQLTQLGHIDNVTLDSLLCIDIERMAPLTPNRNQVMSSKFNPNRNFRRMDFQRPKRPGLADMD